MSAAANASAVTAAPASTGLAVLASGGRSARSRVWRSSGSGSARRPEVMQASAAMTPPPPTLVSTATAGPAGNGWPLSSATAAARSVRVATDWMPPAA